MAYTVNTPLAVEEKKNSQPLMLANFQAIDAALKINHGAFNTAEEGKHTSATMLEQAAATVTLANEAAIYAKQSSLIGDTALFFRKENAGAEYEFTSSIQATPGWTRLPSGILLKWGATTANGLATITLPVAADTPNFATIFSVQITVVAAGATDTDGAVRLVDFTNPLAFDVFASARSTTGAQAVNFEYLVIGV